jgi:hypothetical protein
MDGFSASTRILIEKLSKTIKRFYPQCNLKQISSAWSFLASTIPRRTNTVKYGKISRGRNNQS